MTHTIWTRLALGIVLFATPAVLTGCSEPAPSAAPVNNPAPGSPPPATGPTETPATGAAGDNAAKPAEGKPAEGKPAEGAAAPAPDAAEKK